MLEFARALPPLTTKAFVFSTRGSWNVGRAHGPLKQILKTKGLHVIGEFSCRGFDTVGPLKYIGGVARGRPNAQDLADARTFVRTLVNDER